MIFGGNQISYTYPGALQPTLKGVAFELQQPGLHALFGPSGAGKTSLAKILTALFVIGGTLPIYQELPRWRAVWLSACGRHNI